MDKKWDLNKRAVALTYDPADVAPKIVAEGKGYRAGKILEKAEESHIPVVRDSELMADLEKLNLGDNIPPELYEAVAQILVFIMEIDKSRDKSHGGF